MKRIVSFVTFAVLVLLPVMVLAQDNPCPPVDVNLTVGEQAQTWWMVLLDFLLQLVTPIAIAVLTALAGIAVRKWGKKLDTDKQEALIRLTDNVITAGISFAEEQGRKALRTDRVKTEGAQKLSMATEFVRTQLNQSGLSEIAEEELVKLIEARLAQERARPDGVIPSEVNGDSEGD